jgi:hypothetical protein
LVPQRVLEIVHELYARSPADSVEVQGLFYGSDVKFVVFRLAALGVTGTVVIELSF